MDFDVGDVDGVTDLVNVQATKIQKVHENIAKVWQPAVISQKSGNKEDSSCLAKENVYFLCVEMFLALYIQLITITVYVLSVPI